MMVWSTADAGMGTLRDAINCAMPGDTIRFARALSGDSIHLTSSQLALDKDLSIIAKKDFAILVNGGQINKVFSILAGNNTLIEGIKVISGYSDEGAGVINFGDLRLRNVEFYTNSTTDSIIYNENVLSIEGEVMIKQF